MKPMIPKRSRRLRARAAAMNSHDEEYGDYGPEPNMKLSHAFLVVLMLHVVAVGGLYAFNSLKAGKVAKTAVAKSVGGSDQSSNSPDRNGQKNTDPKQEPPGEKQAPVVAKTSETKTSKTAPEATQSIRPTAPTNKSLLQKAAAIAGLGTGASRAHAQETNVTASPVAEQAAPSATDTYTVEAGDTITRIASKLGVAIPDLEKANGIAGNAILQVGQILKVPQKAVAQAGQGISDGASKVTDGLKESSASTPVTAVGATSINPAAGPVSGTEYTVAKGDSPYKIAKKFKITPDELMKANGITDPKKIQIGQKLVIPSSASKASR